MLDLLFVALLAVLFGVTVLFVKVCDRMIGTDEEAFAGSGPEPAIVDDERVAA